MGKYFHRGIYKKKLGKSKSFQVWVVQTSFQWRSNTRRGVDSTHQPTPVFACILCKLFLSNMYTELKPTPVLIGFSKKYMIWFAHTTKYDIWFLSNNKIIFYLSIIFYLRCHQQNDKKLRLSCLIKRNEIFFPLPR